MSMLFSHLTRENYFQQPHSNNFHPIHLSCARIKQQSFISPHQIHPYRQAKNRSRRWIVPVDSLVASRSVMEEEDLYHNPVFSGIASRVAGFDRRASDEKWIILVPQLVSLEQYDVDAMSLGFLQNHILKQSPYLKDEFITEGGEQRVVLTDGKLYFAGGNAGGSGNAVLFDEVFYNDYGSYTAYCIERPMLGLKKKRNSSRVKRTLPRLIHDETHPLLSEHEGRSVAEWMYLLNKDAGNGRALRLLEDAAEVITSHYVFVLNEVGIGDLMAKVSQSASESFDVLCKSNVLFQHATSNNRSRNILLRALEAYLMTGIHDSIFPTIVASYSNQDNGPEEDGSDGGLNAAKQTESQLAEGISHGLLKRLNESRCPLGRLEGLKAFIVEDEAINAATSADDLLSFLVAQLEQLRSARALVLANLRYMKDFMIHRPYNELGFLLAQLEASTQYLWGEEEKEVEAKPMLRIPESPHRERAAHLEESPEHNSRTNPSRLERKSEGVKVRKKHKRPKKGWGKFLERLQNNTADVVASSFSIR